MPKRLRELTFNGEQPYSFDIDPNIPIPDKGVFKYPWKDMSVGNSFKFPIEMLHRITASSQYYRSITGAKFRVRKIDDEFYRVWRIS